MKRSVAQLVCVLALLGCRAEMAPLASGAVVERGLFVGAHIVSGQAKDAKSWALSGVQIEKLSSWLQLHDSNWHTILASPPPPSYSILLTHLDGSRTQIDLFSINENWRHAVQIFRNDKSGQLIFGGQQHLSTEEIAGLKELTSKEQ